MMLAQLVPVCDKPGCTFESDFSRINRWQCQCGTWYSTSAKTARNCELLSVPLTNRHAADLLLDQLVPVCVEPRCTFKYDASHVIYAFHRGSTLSTCMCGEPFSESARGARNAALRHLPDQPKRIDRHRSIIPCPCGIPVDDASYLDPDRCKCGKYLHESARAVRSAVLLAETARRSAKLVCSQSRAPEPLLSSPAGPAPDSADSTASEVPREFAHLDQGGGGNGAISTAAPWCKGTSSTQPTAWPTAPDENGDEHEYIHPDDCDGDDPDDWAI